MLTFKAKGCKKETAEWSQKDFKEFRTKLALGIGMSKEDLEKMKGLGGKKHWTKVEDDIVDFLKHSDEKGVLRSQPCVIIAKRMSQLIKDWDDNSNDKKQALLLINQMKYCFSHKRTLTFVSE